MDTTSLRARSVVFMCVSALAGACFGVVVRLGVDERFLRIALERRLFLRSRSLSL